MRFFLVGLSLSSLLFTACSGTGPTEPSANDALADGLDSAVVPDVAPGEDPEEADLPPGICPDKICQQNENCNTCPDDCGPCCGNGQCDLAFGETCQICPEDCGSCPTACPDGECDADPTDGYSENCTSCPQDCGECPAECGDGKLDTGEECDDGNLLDRDGCDHQCVEEQEPADCPNGSCEPELDESCKTCPEDCKECCGDALCDADGEENCESCSEDCGLCPGCGDGILQQELSEQCDDGNTEPDDGCSEECQIEIGDVLPGAIVVTEIMKNPEAVGDPDGEWFEIYNTTEADIDINGWTISDEGNDDHAIVSPGGVVVQAEAFFVLARDSEPAVNGGVAADYEYSGFVLGNQDDEIILMAGNVVVDAVKYDEKTFPAGKGKSLTLSADVFSGDGNDLGANWCDAQAQYGDGDWGTPGKPNPNCKAAAVCGNDIVEAPEECDDGNVDPDDGCDAQCKKEFACGDGWCDPGFENSANCPQDCGSASFCGNGNQEPPETCDDGNPDPCDGCSDECQVEACGDGACSCGDTCLSCPVDCGACPACGDQACNGDENCFSCSGDCGQCCPNGQCDADLGETCDLCPADCGACPAVCGNSVLEAGESCDDGNVSGCDGCSPACKVEGCGEGACTCGEDCFNCPVDCGQCCGDQVCNPNHGETCITCNQDCGPCCPNGACDANFGETCATCAADCGACLPVCGDLLCNGAESCASCPQDCSPCCGDNACNAGEKCTSCPADCGVCPACGDQICNGTETCTTCPGDCGSCSSWCSLHGTQGQTVKCDVLLAAQTAQSPKTVGLEMTINYDPAKVTMSKLLCTSGVGDPVCLAMTTQHVVVTDPAAAAAWAGLVKVSIYKNGEPAPITQAYMNGPQVAGQAAFVSLTFTLGQTIPAGQAVQVKLTGVTGKDANSVPLDVAVQSGLLITSAGVPQSICGDMVCGGDETCQTCALDCGVCCGNGKCDIALGESCYSCTKDCGACPVCGDKSCAGGENCANCPGDCGKCPECGDAACNGVETCQTCPSDCGDCCGNSLCEAELGETCSSCPLDCGPCPVCGDAACNGAETCQTCAGDCGSCCGNGKCEPALGETCSSCTQDCGPCPVCGDQSCAAGETCSSCPADCGPCAPVWCALSGAQGASVTCDLKLAAASSLSSKATGLQFKIAYDAAKVSLAKMSCIGAGGLDFCDLLTLLASGHTIAMDPAKAGWNGLISVIIYHGSEPTKPITQAYMSGAQVVGDAQFMTLVFTLKQAIPVGSPMQVALTGLKGTDASASSLAVELQNGVLISTP